MDIHEEKRLIFQAKKDPQIFGKIYDFNYPKILNYILKRTGSLQLAQDLTSEVFFKALKNLWQFQWRNISFSAWLYKIANNEINYYYRKNKTKDVSLDDLLKKNIVKVADISNPHQESLEAEKSKEEKQDLLVVQKVFVKLPLKYQEVLGLRFFADKKIKEICKILNKKSGTVKSLLVRGLDLLKKEIAKEKLLQPFLNASIEKGESLIINKSYENHFSLKKARKAQSSGN